MFKIINCPSDEKQASEMADFLGGAMKDLGISVNGQVFVNLWVTNDIKIILEQDGDEVVGMCLMRHGFNVVSTKRSASIIEIKSKRSMLELYEFSCTVAQALGCSIITSTLITPIEGLEVRAYYQEKSL